MQIEFSPEVALQLEAITVQTRGMEFSGFGFVELRRETGTFYVYEFVLLDVGSSGWTEIEPSKYVHLFDRPDAGKLKLWIHRHPVGDGVPGRHNWSGTDERTCRHEPLGVPYGMQDSLKWALAAVRTPKGWVGRYDTFGPKGTTVHLPVVPGMAQAVVVEIQAIKQAKKQATLQNLRQLIPFVRWDETAVDEEGREGLAEEYENWLMEDDLEEEDLLSFQYMFWGEE